MSTRTVSARDPEQWATYDAETAAFEGTPLADLISEEDVHAHHETVRYSDWWDIRPKVEIRSARADMCNWGGFAQGNTIFTSAGNQARKIVSHELAHVVHFQSGSSNDVAHGAAFRSWHVHTVSYIFGRQYGELLSETYSAHGLVHSLAMLAPEGTRPVIDIDALAIATAPTGGWRRPR